MEKNKLYLVKATEKEIANIGFNRGMRRVRGRTYGIALIIFLLALGIAMDVTMLWLDYLLAGIAIGLGVYVYLMISKMTKEGIAFAKEIKEIEGE